MTKIQEKLLEALSASLKGESVEWEPLSQEELSELYNLAHIHQILPLVYEAVYKVSFKGAEGTETFKVRKIDKLDGIVVGYASDVKPIVAQSDSLAVKKDSVK